MPAPNRLAALALGGLALALTVSGIVLAATDSNPMGPQKDPLTLGGTPPTSAQLLVLVTAGSSTSLKANVNVNFATDSVAATIAPSSTTSGNSVELRLVNKHLYVSSANLASGLWLGVAMKQPSLFPLALEMTNAVPDLGLVRGFGQETVDKSGYMTTYTFIRDNVAISTPLGVVGTPPTLGTLAWSITVGAQGEVVDSALSVQTKAATLRVEAIVRSYNRPANIVAPPTNQVQNVDSSLLKTVLGSLNIGSLLSPLGLGSLGHMTLN